MIPATLSLSPTRIPLRVRVTRDTSSTVLPCKELYDPKFQEKAEKYRTRFLKLLEGRFARVSSHC